MKLILKIILTIFLLIFRILKQGSIKTVVAENIILKQQLITLTKNRKKSPNLKTADRIVMALCTLFIKVSRLPKVAVSTSSSTLLKFHKALVKKKYSLLFSSKSKKKPGRPGPSKELIKFIVEMKEKNPRMGCPTIAMLASNVLEQEITEDKVRRVLKKYYKPTPGGGPSWLAPIGNSPDKLWSLDLFRVESISLCSYWVMVVMDQYTRQIIGFAVREHLDGPTVCGMLFEILGSKQAPKYLSTDNDPLFRFHRWISNLELEEIEEIKSVPSVPFSHPFVERLICSARQDFTDHILFWTKSDLENKLKKYQEYFNDYRVHYAHEGKTPSEIVKNRKLETIKLSNYRWKAVCGGMYFTPIAA